MLDAIIISLSVWDILLAFAWLLWETKFLTVHLPCGPSVKTVKLPVILTTNELLTAMDADRLALPMPKSWDNFAPCPITDSHEAIDNIENVTVIYGKE